jgi:hypothetical protein
MGANLVCGGEPYARHVPGFDRDQPLRDRKGGDPAEWPVYLRIQEFP